MFQLPYVPTAEELVDNVFRKGSKEAKKVRSTKKRRQERLQKSEEKRVETITNTLSSGLKKIVKKFPSYEQLPAFYQQLLDIKVDKNRYKKSLGALQWCAQTVEKLGRETIIKYRRTSDADLIKKFLGRTSSLVKRINSDLDVLIEAKRTFRSFPVVKELPTLVVAGYPNVGKSTFVRNLTGSKIKIATYPFTTKDILIGYKKIGHRDYQIIDSPGLLDRPMEKRNKIELQAILAIKDLASVILLIVDPSLEIEPQLSLLKEIKNKFDIKVLVAINKVDITDPERIKKVEFMFKEYKPLKICAKNPSDCEKIFSAIF